MSVKGRKSRLVISWQKSFSLLAPWRKGKRDRDASLDGEVVLTKMKLFSNFHERLVTAEDSESTVSTASISVQDITKVSALSPLDDKPGKPPMSSSSEYLSAIFSDSQLPTLSKFVPESEDSGVELPSGANSPSTPTSSEQSFVVHSRESSCDSCNLNPDPAASSDKLVTYAQSSVFTQAEDLVDDTVSKAVDTQHNVFKPSEELSSLAVTVELHIGKDMDRRLCGAPGVSLEGYGEMSEQLEENRTVTERTCLEHNGLEPEPIWSTTSDSLDEYMDECCRLSETLQASSNPLRSGLDYLEHICQLIENIGQLQETNLQLQKQICRLKKESRMTKTKEDFFRQHCCCGAASLTFQDVHKRHSRSEFLSPSGTLSDLSTIAEVTQHPFTSTRTGVSSEGLTPVPLWGAGLSRRNYAEGDNPFLRGSTEGLSILQHRVSENYTWSRVKDLVRKTKSRPPSRLGLTSPMLKMSCPQLYMPELGPVQPAVRNRNSMIALGHQSKLDTPWLQ